ncbi:MAG: tRNA (adenosine(37)-N6)-threonylcarbamoyltransferase complex dimerization subunit type 1 TsaB [Wenzhouxiangellaceae bacterium]
MTKLLAIETATNACSVALQVDGQTLERFEVAPRRHGELLLPWCDEVLAEAGIRRNQLDGLVLSRGPGSFTSLRLGLSAGVAIAYALDIPVYPVSSLAAVAWQAHCQHGASAVLAALDARMGEWYVAAFCFDGDQLLAVSDEVLVRPEDVALPPAVEAVDWYGAGTAFSTEAPASLQGRLSAIDADCWPRATALLALSQRVQPMAPSQFEPVYLRERVADVPKAR